MTRKFIPVSGVAREWLKDAELKAAYDELEEEFALSTSLIQAETACKVQSHQDLRNELKAVARGEKSAPADAALPSREG